MQQGRYVAQVLRRRLARVPNRTPFRYRDKGDLATIGRGFAVADLRSIQLSGLLAWLVWVVVHIAYLIGFRNRLLVLIQWAWSYLTFQPGAQIIPEEPVLPPSVSTSEPELEVVY
jgi:NADH dehydrogenase